MIKSQRVRWAGYVTLMWNKKAYNILVGKPEGKNPVGRPMCGWEDSIQVYIKELMCEVCGQIKDRDQ
jgi:hypothetical protein